MGEQHGRGHVGENRACASAVAEPRVIARIESADGHHIRRMVGNRAEQRVGDGDLLDDGVLIARVHLVARQIGDQEVGEFVALVALAADFDDQRLAAAGEQR